MKKTKEPAQKPVPSRSTTAVRGKYFNQMERGTNLVILDPDLMAHFPDSESVNRALHAFVDLEESFKDIQKNVKAAAYRQLSKIPHSQPIASSEDSHHLER